MFLVCAYYEFLNQVVDIKYLAIVEFRGLEQIFCAVGSMCQTPDWNHQPSSAVTYFSWFSFVARVVNSHSYEVSVK